LAIAAAIRQCVMLLLNKRALSGPPLSLDSCVPTDSHSIWNYVCDRTYSLFH